MWKLFLCWQCGKVFYGFTVTTVPDMEDFSRFPVKIEKVGNFRDHHYVTEIQNVCDQSFGHPQPGINMIKIRNNNAISTVSNLPVMVANQDARTENVRMISIVKAGTSTFMLLETVVDT